MHITLSAPLPFREIDICVYENIVILFSTSFNKCADAIRMWWESWWVPFCLLLFQYMQTYTLYFLSLQRIEWFFDYDGLHLIHSQSLSWRCRGRREREDEWRSKSKCKLIRRNSSVAVNKLLKLYEMGFKLV